MKPNYISKGIHEIDMVVNYGYVKSGLWDLVEKDIKSVSTITKSSNIPLKVIFETAQLTIDEIKKTTLIAIKSNADFVKTSTGFNGEGATIQNVEAMLQAAEGKIKVKASGGIRDFKAAKIYIDMGCKRLGIGYPAIVGICKEGASSGNENY